MPDMSLAELIMLMERKVADRILGNTREGIDLSSLNSLLKSKVARRAFIADLRRIVEVMDPEQTIRVADRRVFPQVVRANRCITLVLCPSDTPEGTVTDPTDAMTRVSINGVHNGVVVNPRDPRISTARR